METFTEQLARVRTLAFIGVAARDSISQEDIVALRAVLAELDSYRALRHGVEDRADVKPNTNDPPKMFGKSTTGSWA